MRQYNVEIFDKEMKFVCNSIVEDIKYREDYIDPERYDVDLVGVTDIGINYFVHIQNSEEDYVGIVKSYEEKKAGVLHVTVGELPSIFDVEWLIDVNDFDYTFEEYIKKLIKAIYIDGDASMKMPFNITISSRTEDWSIEYDVENEPDEDEEEPPVKVAFVNVFDDVILPAFTSHQIRLDYKINLNTRTIDIDIGKNENEVITIEADLPNIIEKSVIIRKASSMTNKVIVYNEANYNESVTYYLHPNDEFDKIDADRITPVEFKLLHASEETDKDDDGNEYVSKTFEEVAYEKAAESFGRNKFTNLIELTVVNNDDLIFPKEMKIGQEVAVISDGTIYRSILTGREIRNSTKLIFGTIRLELTKLLKGRG